MNYYTEIRNELINNEITKKVKDYSKNRSDLTTYYNVGKYEDSYIHAKLAYEKWNSDLGWKDENITKMLTYNLDLTKKVLIQKGIIKDE